MAATPPILRNSDGTPYPATGFHDWRDAFAFRIEAGFNDQAAGRGRVLGNSVAECWARPGGLNSVTRPAYDAAAPLSVVSSAASDAAGGAGAEVLLVWYLDANGAFRMGLATMSGATPAAVVEAERDANGNPVPKSPIVPATGVRVQKIFVIQANAGANDKANDGVITCSIGADVQTAMAAEWGQSLHTAFTVPRHFFGVLMSVGATSDQNTNGEARLVVKQRGVPPQRFLDLDISRSSVIQTLTGGRRVAALSDVRMDMVRTNASAADVTTAISYALVPDPNDADQEPELQPSPLG